MLDVMLELWNIVLDGLDILWNTAFNVSDRQIAIPMVVGTFAVAVVAAFQDRIRSRLFAPRLRLEEHRDYIPTEVRYLLASVTHVLWVYQSGMMAQRQPRLLRL
jgi:hypothetical protein